MKRTELRLIESRKFVAYTRYIILIANVLIEKSVSNLPGEYGWAFTFVVGNLLNDVRGGHSWLTAADGSRLDAARLVVAAEYFAHASV